jgi:crotonobetaine/carnitine-CoA ligase
LDPAAGLTSSGPPIPSTPLRERTVLSALRKSTECHPAKPALVDAAGQYTYANLFEAARRAAGAFSGMGVGRQDPVLTMLDNHADHVVTWLGVCFALGIQVPVNTAYKAGILSHIITDSGARLIVIEDAYCERLARIADQVPGLRTVVVRGGAGDALPRGRFVVLPFSVLTDGPAMDPVTARPGDLAAYMYTSGTTGPSRGVLYPYGQTWSCGAPEFFGSARPDDRTLVTLPLFHVAGQFAGVLNAFIAGATAVVRPFFRAATYLDEAREFGCTYAVLVGAMASFVYRQPPRETDARNPLQRVMIFPIIPEFEEFESRFGLRVLTSYGMTEVSSVLVAPAGRVKPRGCGWARSDFEARLVDEHDMEVERGEVGELVLRPRNPWSVMMGYHGHPARTVEMWRNLWIHTGDLMYQDEEGQFFFVDRAKDAIRRRGENVSSFEIEAAIGRHPAILESAAVGVASEASEEEVLAAIVLRPGETVAAEALIRYLVDALPYFMVPRYIRFMEALPKTPTQKVMKHEIRAVGSAGAWDRVAAGLRVDRTGLHIE